MSRKHILEPHDKWTELVPQVKRGRRGPVIKSKKVVFTPGDSVTPDQESQPSGSQSREATAPSEESPSVARDDAPPDQYNEITLESWTASQKKTKVSSKSFLLGPVWVLVPRDDFCL